MSAAPDTYRDTLLYAMAIAGSERALAERLQVKVALLATWLSGIEPIPYAVFLKAVDVVVNSTAADISRSRQLLTTLKFPASPSTRVR